MNCIKNRNSRKKWVLTGFIRALLLVIINMTVCLNVLSEELKVRELYLWSDNLEFEVYREQISNALLKAESRFGKIKLIPANAKSYKRAFERLQNDEAGFDAMISASNLAREEGLIPLYFPLERGLLGVRLCLINEAAQTAYSLVNKNTDFKHLSLKIVTDANWPDSEILQSNNIPIVELNSHTERLEYTRQNQNVCYSRSIFEIQSELAKANDLLIEADIVLVYPQADILYFRKNAAPLVEAVRFGLEQAYADGSFQEIYNKYFSKLIADNQLYERKILFLHSPLLSSDALNSINQYGIFSFINYQNKQ